MVPRQAKGKKMEREMEDPERRQVKRTEKGCMWLDSDAYSRVHLRASVVQETNYRTKQFPDSRNFQDNSSNLHTYNHSTWLHSDMQAS